jgi:hypothetical protein
MDRLRAVYASLRALLALGVAHGLSPEVRAQPLDPEDRAWARALEEGTAEAFQGYLEAYPLGRYATEAFRETVARSLGSRTLPEPAAGPGGARAADLY